jgi:putative transposase
MAGKHLSLLVHFVWSRANREPWIKKEWQHRLFGYMGGVLRHDKIKLIEAGGMDDHIHLYTSLPSTISIAELVNSVKSNSSRWVHETFPRRRGFAWQKGYGAFSVSKSSESQVLDYIKGQEAHHRKRTFKEEFLALLEKHEIDYHERYLWD